MRKIFGLTVAAFVLFAAMIAHADCDGEKHTTAKELDHEKKARQIIADFLVDMSQGNVDDIKAALHPDCSAMCDFKIIELLKMQERCPDGLEYKKQYLACIANKVIGVSGKSKEQIEESIHLVEDATNKCLYSFWKFFYHPINKDGFWDRKRDDLIDETYDNLALYRVETKDKYDDLLVLVVLKDDQTFIGSIPYFFYAVLRWDTLDDYQGSLIKPEDENISITVNICEG